ncbi:MAG: CotH kinase family protein, partial [Candidatus Enteromonas sp.]|nr:CotH kinase family protein [Candidatus Enteromonas sp.]
MYHKSKTLSKIPGESILQTSGLGFLLPRNALARDNWAMKPQRFVLAIPFLLASCSLSPVRGSSSSSSQGIESPSISSSIPQESSSSSVEAPAEVDTPFTEEALRFFDASDVNVNIAFTPEALRFMSDYQSDQKKYDDVYLPAEVSIRFEGKDYVYPDAGVRMKGNTSRRKIYDEDGVVANLVHFKVTFKETFDDDIYSDELLQGFARDWSEDADGRKARKKRNFLGLSKLDLKYVTRNTSTGGDCILREIYAYRAFEKAGVPTPKAGLTTLTFGDGVTSLTSHYETVETIDKDFLKRRFSKAEAKGDLYKCVYGPMGKGDLSRSGAIDYVIDENGYCSGKAILRGKIGVENNYEYYNPCYDLKTNDDGDNSDFSSMANFIANMWNLVYAGAPATLLESTLHVDEFLRYSAMAYLIGNFDDARFNYNNYYLYFLPSTGQAIYIPYDYD